MTIAAAAVVYSVKTTRQQQWCTYNIEATRAARLRTFYVGLECKELYDESVECMHSCVCCTPRLFSVIAAQDKHARFPFSALCMHTLA